MIRGEIIELYNLSYFQGGNDLFLMPFVEELPTYHVLCQEFVGQRIPEDDNTTDSCLLFWQQNVITLPIFSELAWKMATCSPSSATVERLFSLLGTFHDNQANALADYAKARTMIRYNYNFRRNNHE